MTQQKRRLTDRVKKFATVIGQGSVINGTLGGKDDYIILGRVEGNADLQGTLIVQEGGEWQGDMTADYIILCGKVNGDICARTKLEITNTAQVTGNISGQSIAIAEGAVFEGEIRMQMKQDVTYFDDQRNARALAE